MREVLFVMFQFLTCAFKLHNPSRHKRDVMDFALDQYTRGYAAMLDAVNVDLLRRDGKYVPKDHPDRWRYTAKSIAPLLARPQVELHSSVKDSLLQAVAGNLASYLELERTGANTGFPVCRNPNPVADKHALDHFIHVGADQDDYDQSRAKYLAVARGSVMPVYFCRADAASQTPKGSARNRNFSLLWNTHKRQLLAVLYLLPQGHPLGHPLGVTQHLARLDTGEVFKSNSRGAILVPLEGRNGWQEDKFLQPAMQDHATAQTAYLVRDDRSDEYFLHVAFRIECAAQYEPVTWLGIDKGILFTAAYAVVSADDGRVVTLGHFDDELRALQIKHGKERERLARNGKKVMRRHYKRKAYDNILHTLANELIAMALKYQAGIVVEDLDIKVRGGRVISRFRKFDRILRYKCRLAGVPFRSVFAAWSSQICHHCGETMGRDDRLVTCPACGYAGHSDDNAAVNIARRAMYHKDDWKGRGGHRAFHRSFANTSTF